jgi:7-keto-8-aminopelargonate synthetase-like enzyme
VPDCITFTAGHTTNAVVLGHLFGPDDLILHDELVHNSIVFGCRVSGAERRSFPHNDWQAADDYLREMRDQYRKVVVVIEGLYSMDGDYPDLPKFVDVKNRHKAWLYVDEAHSIGSMGETGRGLAEMYGVPRDAAEIWMGTLSKALGACGGFVGARKPIIRYLKYTCPGVVFTIGLSPASCGAALEAIRIISSDNSRIRKLHENAAYFLEKARAAGFNTGDSHGSPIVPVILGDSLQALQASRRMHDRGISVQPIMYPAVPNELARLRFFINTLHTREQMDKTIDALKEVLGSIG